MALLGHGLICHTCISVCHINQTAAPYKIVFLFYFSIYFCQNVTFVHFCCQLFCRAHCSHLVCNMAARERRSAPSDEPTHEGGTALPVRRGHGVSYPDRIPWAFYPRTCAQGLTPFSSPVKGSESKFFGADSDITHAHFVMAMYVMKAIMYMPLL